MKLTKSGILLNKDDIKTITKTLHDTRANLLYMQEGYVNHEQPWFKRSFDNALNEVHKLDRIESDLKSRGGNL